jgi:DNA replication protein DnaC
MEDNLCSLKTSYDMARVTDLSAFGGRAPTGSSQLPVDKWHQYIGENTIADAIMDRLAGNAHRFDLKGESLRKKRNEKND